MTKFERIGINYQYEANNTKEERLWLMGLQA